MILVDLKELKSILELDPGDTSEDKKLNFYVEWASEVVEDYLNRKNRLFYKSRTEFYDGTNTLRLPLRCRPVYATPTVQVWVDEAGYFGAPSGAFNSTTALTYGTDFYLDLDQDTADGTSRSGILVRPTGVWPRPFVRSRGLLSPYLGSRSYGTIKVTYTAGYTFDTLPSPFRAACHLLVAKLRYVFPLGQEIAAESYEERSLSFMTQRQYLHSIIKPFLHGYRNWRF